MYDLRYSVAFLLFKVIRGRYENETGLLLVYEPNLCLVLPDRGMSEIRVAPRDLRLWQDRGGLSDCGQMDGVQLMDFVQIDAHTSGVVTQVDRESISVLTCLGKIVTVKANTALRIIKFGGPRGVQPQALDRNGNVIQVMRRLLTVTIFLFKLCNNSITSITCNNHLS